MLLHPRVVHRFAVATAVATYLLILIGGLVHGTGSSLACPDWPTCYGSLMPKMEGGVLIEHSHRLAAGTVVIMTLVLAGLLTASARRRAAAAAPVRLAGGGAGVHAGAAGRDHRHSPAAHARLDGAHRDVAAVLPDAGLRRGAIAACAEPRSGRPAPPSVARMAIVAAVAIYFQMLLGGLVRHSGAALACTDVPLCRGSLWPDAHPTVLIQALHRLTGVAVALLVFASSIVTLRRGGARRDLRALAIARARAGVPRRSRSASSPSPASSTSPPSRRTSASRPRCSRRRCSSR